MAKVIRKIPVDSLLELTGAQKYQLLEEYADGLSMNQIADKHSFPRHQVTDFLSSTISSLAAIRETNTLNSVARLTSFATPVSMMNKDFLDNVENNADTYSFYFATSGSNVYALEESGLDKDLPANCSPRAKKLVYAARGRYLRSIPHIAKQITAYREQRIKDTKVGKIFIQSELIEQLEEMKELAQEDPRYRGFILKNIELLGKTEAAFTETLNVNDTSTKSGMELLMDKIKGEI